MNNHNDASQFGKTSFFTEQEKVKPDQNFQENLRTKVLAEYSNSTYYNTNMDDKKSKLNWRRILPAGGGFIAVLIAIFVAVGVFNTGNEEVADRDSNLGGEIAYVEGEVEYQDSEDTGWKTASVDQSISEGNLIRVNGSGRAIINLDDGSSVRLNTDSEVVLSSLNPNSIVITNNEGEVYTRVEKLERDFVVETTNGSFKSLGTAYKTINTADSEGVLVYQSKVEVEDKAESDSKNVEEGKAYFIKDEEKEEKEVIELTKEDIEEDEFAQWNKEQDESIGADLGIFLSEDKAKEKSKDDSDEDKKEDKEEKVNAEDNSPSPSPTPAPQPAPNTNPSITLSGISGATGRFTVSWATQDLNIEQGYKVVYTTSGTPTYGTHDALYVSNSGATSATVNGLAAGNYNVRVCRYTGSGCDFYSNQLSVTVEGQSLPSSINLTRSGNTLSWTTNNGESGNGFKVVRSDSTGPTYPANSIQFTESFSFTMSQNGYYRICAWDGGSSCSAYSNEIHVTDL